MSRYGVSEGMDIQQEDGEKFIQQFYTAYPNIKIYYDNYLKNARIHGFVETMLGRRRYVFEDQRKKFIDNGTRRVLMNYPIQGAAADLMKKGMVAVQEKILTKYPKVWLLLTIHDDLVFEIPYNHKRDKVISEIKNLLCSVYPLAVPLTVDVKVGKQWGSLQKFE